MNRAGLRAKGAAPLLAACLIMVMLAAPTVPAAAQTYEMKLATATIRDPNEMWLNEFKKRIEERTGGRISAKVFPAGQLGDIQRVVEGMQLGTIEFSNIPPSFLVGLNPALQVVEAPGIFASHEHAQRALTDAKFRDRFVALAEDKGISGLSLWVYGPNAYATLRPFRSLADLKGMKIGVRAAKVETDLMAQLGAAGVPVTFTEVLPALSSRTIDGYRGALVVLYGRQFQTVTKYVTLLDDGMVAVVGWASKAFLDKLPADLRQTVVATAREMDAMGFATAVGFGKNARKLWSEAGGEVIELSPAEQADALRRVLPVSTENLGAHPHPQTREMFALMREMADKHRSQ